MVELPIAIRGTDARTYGHIQFATSDLSTGGAFIRSDLLFEIGEKLALMFTLPGGRSVRAHGNVVRVSRSARSGPGMGIEFQDLSTTDRDAIFAMVTRGTHG